MYSATRSTTGCGRSLVTLCDARMFESCFSVYIHSSQFPQSGNENVIKRKARDSTRCTVGAIRTQLERVKRANPRSRVRLRDRDKRHVFSCSSTNGSNFPTRQQLIVRLPQSRPCRICYQRERLASQASGGGLLSSARLFRTVRMLDIL